MKRIVIYYSLEGNTAAAARTISRKLCADRMRLRPVKETPRRGVAKFMIGGFEALFAKKPKLRPFGTDVTKYDEIILGMPVWAGRPAPVVNTLIEDYDVADKITSVFTFSGSGNNKGCLDALKKKLPGIRHTVSLYDRNSDAAAENGEKIERFTDEILF